MRILEENRRIALNDPWRFVDDAGNLLPMSAWTAEMAAAVSKIEVVKKNVAAGGHTDTILKLWFWDKSHAIELFFKHLRLLQEQAATLGAGGLVFIMPPGSSIAIE